MSLQTIEHEIPETLAVVSGGWYFLAPEVAQRFAEHLLVAAKEVLDAEAERGHG